MNLLALKNIPRRPQDYKGNEDLFPPEALEHELKIAINLEVIVFRQKNRSLHNFNKEINCYAWSEYIFTFGFGYSLENCYTIVYALTHDDAREIMIQVYGKHWAFQYDSKEEAGVKEYNLEYVPFGTQNRRMD